MRLLSTVAMSFALVATAGLTVPTAAYAKKKDKEEEKGPAPLKPSRKFAKNAVAVQKLVGEKKYDEALAKLPEAEATAETPDDNYFLGSFYLNIGIGKKDQSLQRKGLDAMLASGRVQPDLVPRYEVEAGKLAQVAKDLPAARDHYNKAIAAGNKTSDPYVLLAESYFGEAFDHIDGNNFTPEGKALAQQGLPYLKKAIEIENATPGKEADAAWYTRGMKMAVLSGSPEQFDWARMTVAHAPTSTNWRLALRALQDANPGLSRENDLNILRLMRITKSLGGDYSYSEYASQAWPRLPGELVSLIDSGVASGEIKKDRYADLYKLAVPAMAKDKATLAESAADAAKAANGKSAAGTADAYMSYGEYDKAADLYRMALSKGGVDTDLVNTHLGIDLVHKGDLDGARTAFQAVTADGLRGEIAKFWLTYIDTQSKAAEPAPEAAPEATPAESEQPQEN